jgi:hypothetical protein
VDTLKIANQAVNVIRTTSATTSIILNHNAWTNVGSISFTPASVNGVAQPISVKGFFAYNATVSGQAYAGDLFVRVRRGGTTLTSFQVGTFLIGISGGAIITEGAPIGSVTPIALDSSTTVSSRTYSIDAKYVSQSSTSSDKWQIISGALMECVEVKR